MSDNQWRHLSPANRDPGAQPAINLPGPVIAVLGVILIVQVLMWLNPANAHGVILWFSAVRTGSAVEQFGAGPLNGFAPYLLHAFVHFGWVHTLMNAGFIAAFGAAAARGLEPGLGRWLGFFAFYAICAVAGAVTASLLTFGDGALMVGASTAASGMAPAAGYVFGGQAMMTRFTGVFLALNLVLAAAELFTDLGISWQGHIGGLLAGALIYPWLARLVNGER